MNRRIAVFTNGFSNEFIEHVVTGLQMKAGVPSSTLDVSMSSSRHSLMSEP